MKMLLQTDTPILIAEYSEYLLWPGYVALSSFHCFRCGITVLVLGCRPNQQQAELQLPAEVCEGHPWDGMTCFQG